MCIFVYIRWLSFTKKILFCTMVCLKSIEIWHVYVIGVLGSVKSHPGSPVGLCGDWGRVCTGWWKLYNIEVAYICATIHDLVFLACRSNQIIIILFYKTCKLLNFFGMHPGIHTRVRVWCWNLLEIQGVIQDFQDFYLLTAVS